MSNSMFDDPNLARALIMDHYQYPHNHELLENVRYSKHMASDSCIDDITVQAVIEDGMIKDIRFAGVGCTISTASTSMMTDLLIGKSTEEAKTIIAGYLNMVNDKSYDADALGEANVFKNIYKQANRIKCATIGWDAINELIDESEKDDGR